MKPVNMSESPSGINTTQKTKVERQPLPPIKDSDKGSAANTRPTPDHVKLSSRAEEIHRMVARAHEAGDVRRERVEHLRKLIHSDRYHVSSSDIADAIMRDEK
jgi:flagellar biosynthesis anti-sigma factor FlgM